MTEMNRNTEVAAIQWVPFVTSLVVSPIALSTAIIGPMYALDMAYSNENIHGLMLFLVGLCAIGTVFYLVIGTPVLIWHLSSHLPAIGRIVALSIFSVLAFLPVGALFSILTFEMGPLMIAAICTGFGLIGAPLLALIFTVFYKKLTSA